MARPGSRRERERAARRRRKLGLLALVVAAGVIAAVGALAFLGPPPASPPPATNEALHQHASVKIILAGEQQVLPSDIGLNPERWVDHTHDAYGEMGSMSPLHTHDRSGIIHLEHSRYHPCTLGDFFSVWGQPFDEGHAMQYTGQVTMTVDGEPSSAFGTLLLQDGQEIEIRAG